MTTPLQVPPQFRQPLQAFAELTDDDWDRIFAVVDQRDRLARPEQLVERINDAVPAFADMAEDLVESLISLNALRSRDGVPAERLAKDLVHSPSLSLPDAVDLESFASRMEQMLCASAIRLTSKAIDLVNDYPRVFKQARILTDMRPVFPDDRPDAPMAAVIVSTLKIDYFDSEGDSGAMYVALDHGDLLELQEVISKGLTKSGSMKGFLKSANLAYLEDES